MKYRAEIDGLRALAVVPVILFHAGFELFSGGFVGVDVFFVISGYLITTILIEDIVNKRFSIVNFYERRARRILPSLLGMLLLINLFYVIFDSNFSDQFISRVGEFSLSSIGFISNYTAYKTTGYFAAKAEMQPLLHTWSLSVEEQFYLLFPLTLLLSFKLLTQRAYWFYVVIAMLSFFGSSIILDEHPSINFYFSGSRAWELLGGSLVAFYITKYGRVKNELGSFIGLLLIISPVITFDSETPFPGPYSSIPVVGAMLVILCTDRTLMLGKILSNKILVGLGLISYSLYLWHQPVLAIYRSTLLHPHYDHVPLLLLAGILFISWLSWKFIETPFRNKDSSLKVLFGITLLVIFVSSINFAKGIYTQSNKQVNSTKDLAVNGYDCVFQDSYCTFGSIKSESKVLLLGNSHARMLIPNLHNKLASIGVRGVHANGFDLAGIDDDFLLKKDYGEAITEKYWTNVCDISSDSEVTIVSYRWVNRYLNGHDNYFYDQEKITINKSIIDLIDNNIKRLARCSNTLVVVGPVPEIPYYAPNFYTNSKIRDSVDRDLHDFYSAPVNAILDTLKIDKNIYVVKPSNFLCDEEVCNSVNGDQSSYYYDDDHLSSFGSSGITDEIVKLIHSRVNQ